MGSRFSEGLRSSAARRARGVRDRRRSPEEPEDASLKGVRGNLLRRLGGGGEKKREIQPRVLRKPAALLQLDRCAGRVYLWPRDELLLPGQEGPLDGLDGVESRKNVI